MNILHYFESLPEPERKEFASSYREQVLRALWIAQTYDGSETKYQELTGTLIALEKWLKDSLGVTSSKRISHRDERRLSSEIFNGTQRIAIDDILSFSGKRLSHILQGKSLDSFDDLLRSLNITSVALPGIILPPGSKTPPEHSLESRSEIVDTKSSHRFSQFISLLQKHGIFTDDILVCHGEITNTMMRPSSYYIVEIPRLDKQVLICNEANEATFVIQGTLARNELMSLTKEQLLEKYPDRVTRILYTSSAAWDEQICLLLFADGIQGKLDVGFQEVLRAEIIKRVPTAQKWAQMAQKDRIIFHAGGLGLTAIATRFGVKGIPINHTSVHLELGRKIYGECEKNGISLEALKTAIIRQIPTAEQWSIMTQKEMNAFEKISGLGLSAIATRFGIAGTSFQKRAYHLVLGREIYGACEVLRDEEISLEELRTAILEQVPTFQEWSAMTAKNKYAFKSAGLGLKTIATRFGIIGDVRSNHARHLELGRKIYGVSEGSTETYISTFSISAPSERSFSSNRS